MGRITKPLAALSFAALTTFSIKTVADPVKLPPTTKFETTIVGVETKFVNEDLDKDKAGVTLMLTLSTAAPNCGADMNYSVKDVLVQEHLSANNMTTFEKDGKTERVTRALGEDEKKLKVQFVPAVRGYAPDDLKGTKLTVNSYQWNAKVLEVKETQEENPNLDFLFRESAKLQKEFAAFKKVDTSVFNEEELKAHLAKVKEMEKKATSLLAEIKREQAKKTYELVFDSSFPSRSAQLVVVNKGKREFLSLDAAGGYAPQYQHVKKAKFNPGTPFQIADPKALVGKQVTVCSYSSLWDFGFNTSWGN